MTTVPRTSYRPLAFAEHNAARLRKSDLRIVITGASGWLGQATLEMLEAVFDQEFRDRVTAFGSRARELVLRSGRKVALAAMEDLPRLKPSPTLLLHYAYLTKDKTLDLTHAEYNRRSETIRQLASDAIARIGVTRLLLPSSGAVYGLPTSIDRALRPDPINNPYGTQKIRDEQHFLTLCRERAVRVAIPRVFNLAGPYINKHNSYALSSVINAALAGGPVVLRAAKKVIRAYLSVRDVIEVSIGWLLEDTEPHHIVFDACGEEPIEVGELAKCILDVMGRPDIRIERPDLDSDAEDRYLGDGAQFKSLARNQGIAISTLRSQIQETAEYLARDKRGPQVLGRV